MISPHDPVETVLYEDLLDYTPFPRSVRLARYRMARLLWEWGYGYLVDDAELVVSEPLTNAIVHGRVPGRLVRVHLMVGKEMLRVAVSDAKGEVQPAVRESGADGVGGWGLLLVQEVAVRWGVRDREIGKTVWCELDVRRGRPSGPGRRGRCPSGR
ncbi:ATP-binding protein [Streptomyces rimosus]|uniref:ATP-binding protein n=1 Tax=Streptomyces rimosus TaxID=1927 RepID=UPI0004C0AFFE|nr:ATP-binding protein [Streptomyces rimosus]